METLSSLSATARTALALWLAQSPPEPAGESPASLAVCARLARLMVRKSAAQHSADCDRAGA